MNSDPNIMPTMEHESEDRGTIAVAPASPEQPASDGKSGKKPTLRSMRAAAEVLAITDALRETGWNRKRAAQLLSISYRGLLYKIRQHGIVS
jgi:DNA-binding NtrC family response regulator